jgi:hypothetical protein
MYIDVLGGTLVLGALLDEVRQTMGEFELLDHWQQGEFHHDVVLRVEPGERLPGGFLVVATNCNGGVKEVLCFAQLPERNALWRHRCPENAEFTGALPPILARSQTAHWFDPCELLLSDARSELLPEHRERQAGGGWVQKGCGAKAS